MRLAARASYADLQINHLAVAGSRWCLF